MSVAVGGTGPLDASFVVIDPDNQKKIPQPQEDAEEEAERDLVASLPDPVWAGALKDQEELLRFQTECKTPELRVLIDELVKLKQQNNVFSEKEQAWMGLVKMYADPLLKQVEHKLFRLINDSPALKSRLTHFLSTYREEDKHIDFRDVIEQLEREVKAKSQREPKDDWVYVNPGKEHVNINLELELLKDLKQQITLIQGVIAGSTDGKEFLLEVQAIRKKGHLPKPEAGWDNHYESAITAYSIISGLATAGRVLQALSPSLVTALQLLFPSNTLTVISLLLRVLTAASASE